MSVYETNITNPKKQLEFYKDLSEQLQKENQELKKQLEVGKEQYTDLVEEKEKIKESHDSLVLKHESQQKEFIEWLEKQIKLCKEDIFEKGAIGDSLILQLLRTILINYKEILSKYKETIGADTNEK